MRRKCFKGVSGTEHFYAFDSLPIPTQVGLEVRSFDVCYQPDQDQHSFLFSAILFILDIELYKNVP